MTDWQFRLGRLDDFSYRASEWIDVQAGHTFPIRSADALTFRVRPAVRVGDELDAAAIDRLGDSIAVRTTVIDCDRDVYQKNHSVWQTMWGPEGKEVSNPAKFSGGPVTVIYVPED